jgi:ferredoxin
MEFGAKIQDKITALPSLASLPELKVSGRFPYLAGGARSMPVTPVTDPDVCTTCGTCAEVCPTAAIPENEPDVTRVDLCIRCCACIKTCPEGARRIEDKMWKNITTGLSQFFTYPKEPRLFGIGN